MSALALQGALGLIGCSILGLAVGGVYFGTMWWSAALLAAGGRVCLASALIAGRFVLIVSVLVLVTTRGGAVPLLATAFGIATARALVMRRVKVMMVAP